MRESSLHELVPASESWGEDVNWHVNATAIQLAAIATAPIQTVPQTTDLALVRDILNRDRIWAAYAIGDLAAGFVDFSEWRVSEDGSALLLLYRGFNPPILFGIGPRHALSRLLHELDAAEVSLHIKPEMVGALPPAYTPADLRPMNRMSVSSGSFRPATRTEVVPISTTDAGAVDALYADGLRQGDGPTFFHASMLKQGTFYGVWENGSLIAIAGTHLYSHDEGVCAIGNVYTRSDRRGRGLGTHVTSAVVTHALRDGIQTIVLNVGRDNLAAQRVYERLGFAVYCEFVEGEAHRSGARQPRRFHASITPSEE